MTILSTSDRARLRPINLELLISNLNLSIRSRHGFYALIALARVGGVALIFLRFLIVTKDTRLVSLVFLFIGFLYSVSIALFSKKVINQYDASTYHLSVIVIDTVLAGSFIFITGYATTDLYLFYFLPLATAAHLLKRKSLLVIGPTVILSYLVVLCLEPYTIFGRDVFIPWMGKAVFLLVGTLVLRAQRGLPNPNESWIVAPTKARDRLEKMLTEVQGTFPYSTASVQLIYRDRLQIVACQGFQNSKEIYQIEFPVDDPKFPNHIVVKSVQPKIEDPRNFDSFQDKNYFAAHIKSWMGIPLVSPATGECFGMISIDSSELNAFSNFDLLQAGWFAKKVSSFLVDVALGPAALTMATNRENLLETLKSWSELLPGKTSKWDDDLQASHDLIHIGQQIFRTEDCSIFFLRYNFVGDAEEPVLHLIDSTAIPRHLFQKHEMKVTGQKKDGLTGLVVHRNRTLNYGAVKIANSPYRANFTYHLSFLFSKTSRQVMIAPLRDSKGNAVGAIKIENRMGTSSQKEFLPVEKKMFEMYASMVSLILETIRQREYINRLDGGIHGLRGVVHHAAITPIQELINQFDSNQGDADAVNKLNEIQHALEYVKMGIHGVLADSVDNVYLEKEGLIHAVHHYLKSLRSIPFLKEACDCIKINSQNAREDELPFHVQEVFFNVAKEGILNIVRHSKIEQMAGGTAEISLTREGDTFILSVEDNGVGFLESEEVSRQKRSFGLNDIKKQMQLKQYFCKVATVDVKSSPGRGTMIQACWAP